MTKWAKSLVEGMNIVAAFIACIALLMLVLVFTQDSFSIFKNMPLLAFLALLACSFSLVFWAAVLGVLADISTAVQNQDQTKSDATPTS